MSGAILHWLTGPQPLRYIHSFGWTLRDVRSRDIASFLLSGLRELEQKLDLDLLLEEKQRVDSMTSGELAGAIERSSTSSHDIGGATLTTTSDSLSVVIRWSSTVERRFSSITTTVNDELVMQEQQTVTALTSFWQALAEELAFEYLYAAHTADEKKKRRLSSSLQKKIENGRLPWGHRAGPLGRSSTMLQSLKLIMASIFGVLSASVMLWSSLRLLRTGFHTSGEWLLLFTSGAVFFFCFLWVGTMGGEEKKRWGQVVGDSLAKCDLAALPQEMLRLARGFSSQLERECLVADLAPESLPLVTTFLRQKRQQLVCKPDVLLGASAFFGEILRQELDGIWVLKSFPRTDLVVRLGQGRIRHDLSPGIWVLRVAESSEVSLTEIYENERRELRTVG